MLQSQAVRPSDYGPFQAFATIDARVFDGEVGAYWLPQSAGDNSLLAGGIIFRYVDANNFMLVHYWQDRVYLWKMVAGSFVHIALADVAPEYSSWHWMAVRFSGSSLTVNWDGVDVIQATDSTNQNATRHGVWFRNVSDCRSLIGTFRVRSQGAMQPPAVTSVSVSADPLNMPIASSTTLTATAYSNGVVIPTATFSWQSSDTSKAWIQSTTQNTAKIVASAVGAAQITVTAQSGSSTLPKTVPVNVTNYTTQPWQVLINDEFVDTNGTSLAAHMPETNLSHGTWALGGTPSTPGITIDGQAVKPAGVGTFDTYATIDARTSDADVGLYWLPDQAADPSQVAGGVIFRYVDDSNYLLAHYWQQQLMLWKKTPSGFVQLGGVTLAQPSNAWHWLEVRGTGPTITINWDGVDQFHVADSTNLIATRHGIWWRSVADWHSTIGTFVLKGTLPEPIDSVVVTPGSSTIPIEGATVLTARGYGHGGTYVPTATFTWSAQPAAGVVSLQSPTFNTVRVVGSATGSASVKATASGGTADRSVPVTVTQKCMGTCIFDSFTGSGSLGAHIPDTNVMGSSWQLEGGSDVQVYTDRIRATGSTIELATIEGGNNNGTIIAQWLPAIGTEQNPTFGLLARYVSSNEYYLATYNNRHLQLFKRFNGGITQIGDAQIYDDLSSVHDVQVRLDGPGIQVWWDGQQRIQAVDSAYESATRHGVYFNTAQDPSSYLDNFIFDGGEKSVPVSATIAAPSPALRVAYGNTLTAGAFTAPGVWIPWTSFTWHSSNSAIATVSSTGLASAWIVGLASGAVDITATSSEGVVATFHVVVMVDQSEGTVNVFDTFDGVMSTALSNHEPNRHPSSATWSTIGADGIRINDLNEIYPLQHDVYELGTIETGTANGTVSANWRPYNSNIYSNGGIVFRYVSDSSYWYAYVIERQLRLVRVTAASHETIASVGIGNPTNKRLQIAAILDGPRIQIWFNGTLQIEATNSMNQTATRHGVFFHSAYDGQSSLDDFSVNTEFITPKVPPQPVFPCFNGAWPPHGQYWATVGGTGTATLSAPFGCAWQASTTNYWIHLAATSGIGDAYLEYSVDLNTGGERFGSIVINGWVFPIQQAPGGTLEMTFEVLDAVTSAPIQDAKVALRPNYGGEGPRYTGSNGRVIYVVGGGSLSYTISKAGYITKSDTFAVTQADLKTILLEHGDNEPPDPGSDPGYCDDPPVPDPNDLEPDDRAINCLIRAGGDVALAPGFPGYIIADGLRISTDFVTLRGVGSEPPRLIAGPWLNAPMLDAGDWTGYEIRNLVFDGSRNDRRLRDANCISGDRSRGYNLKLRGAGFTVDSITSQNALCGSAMEIDGSDFTISNNRLIANGFQFGETPGLEAWADGITLGRCTNSNVFANYLEDNTDVDLIVGRGNQCSVYENTIVHQARYSFAGLMIAFGGNHADSRVYDNTVTSAPNLISVGLMIGEHPWSTISPNVTISDVGTVSRNTINGAVTLMWIDGIQAGTVVDNILLNRQGTQQIKAFQCIATPVYAAYRHGSELFQTDPPPVALSFHDGHCP